MEKVIKLNALDPYIESNVNLQLTQAEKKEEGSVPWIAGPPGMGKSAYFEQVARSKGYGLCVAYMATMLLEQITGLPKVSAHNPLNDWLSQSLSAIKESGKELPGLAGVEIPDFNPPEDKPYTQWSIPELFSFQNMRVMPKDMAKDPILLVLDDAHLINKQIQGYMFQLLTYRSIHGHRIPNNVAIFMAGNRSEDKAGFQQILAPVTNRIFFLDTTNDVEGWIKNYANKHPQVNQRTDIISYLSYYPEQFNSSPMESKAWASPRSWTNAAVQLTNFEATFKTEPNNEQIFQIMKGHIGDEYTGKFIEYRSLLMKWKAGKILDGKEKVNVKTLDKVNSYSLMVALVNELIRDFRVKKFKVEKKDVPRLELFKGIVQDMMKVFKPIVPLGLRMLTIAEAEFGKTKVTDTLLDDKDVLREVSKVL